MARFYDLGIKTSELSEQGCDLNAQDSSEGRFLWPYINLNAQGSSEGRFLRISVCPINLMRLLGAANHCA